MDKFKQLLDSDSYPNLMIVIYQAIGGKKEAIEALKGHKYEYFFTNHKNLLTDSSDLVKSYFEENKFLELHSSPKNPIIYNSKLIKQINRLQGVKYLNFSGYDVDLLELYLLPLLHDFNVLLFSFISESEKLLNTKAVFNFISKYYKHGGIHLDFYNASFDKSITEHINKLLYGGVHNSLTFQETNIQRLNFDFYPLQSLSIIDSPVTKLPENFDEARNLHKIELLGTKIKNIEPVAYSPSLTSLSIEKDAFPYSQLEYIKRKNPNITINFMKSNVSS